MMSFIWRSPKRADCKTAVWHASALHPAVHFAVRRVSLGERIALTAKLRNLCVKHEFLKAGDTHDQLEGVLGDLLVKAAYIEWGLAAIRGLFINGRRAKPAEVVQSGPESLADEIVLAIKAELGLTDAERKNS